MEKFKLYVDFDDCILRTGPNTDSKLYDSYKYASKLYFEKKYTELKEKHQKVVDFIETKRIEINNKVDLSMEAKKSLLDDLYAYEMRCKMIYDRLFNTLKEDEKYRYVNLDFVLEVLNNEGKGTNRFVNYDDLINESGFIDDAKSFINEILSLENVDSSVLSHCNSMDEALVKNKFINRNFGNMNVICLPFHSDDFKTFDRVNNSKAVRTMIDNNKEILDLNFVLIDDNKNNIKDWNARGGRGILFTKKHVEGFPYQMHNMSMNDFLGCFNEDEKKDLLGKKDGKRI